MSQVQAFHLNILTCHLSSKSNITIRNITRLGLVVTDCTWQQIPIIDIPQETVSESATTGVTVSIDFLDVTSAGFSPEIYSQKDATAAASNPFIM